MAPPVKSLAAVLKEPQTIDAAPADQSPSDGQQPNQALVAQDPKPPDWQQIKDAFDALTQARHGRLQYVGWEINRDDQGDIHVIVYTGRAPEAR